MEYTDILIKKLKTKNISVDDLYSKLGYIISRLKSEKTDLMELSNYKIKNVDPDSIIIYSILFLCFKLRNFVVNSEDEFKNPKHSKKYNIIVCNTREKIKLFIMFCILYKNYAKRRMELYTDKRKKSFVGIDFEFAKQKIALMQINFDSPSQTNMNSFIFIIDPKEFTVLQKNILIKCILINSRVFKIFHGADSLDLPYLFDQVFEGNSYLIREFITRFYDTRFLCEFYRYSVGEDGRCSIYNALLYFNTISKKQFEKLEDTHDKMGPIYKISWDIHKINEYYIKYAFYDVMFLPEFFKDIYKRAFQSTPEIYKKWKYVNEITRFVLLEKRSVTNIIKVLKKDIDKYNNMNYKKGKMFEVYDYVKEKINHELVFLFEINYFKSSLTVLIKWIVYANIGMFKVSRLNNMLKRDGYDKVNEFIEEINFNIIKILKVYK